MGDLVCWGPDNLKAVITDVYRSPQSEKTFYQVLVSDRLLWADISSIRRLDVTDLTEPCNGTGAVV